MTSRSAPRRAIGAVRDAWDGFLFARVSTVNAVAIRIAFGFVILGWALSLWSDLFTFFSGDGVLPEHPSNARWAWGLLEVSSSDPVVLILWVAMVLSAIGLILGIAPRLMCVVILVAIVSFLRRNPYIDNSGDLLLRNWAFLFLFLPMGAALTLPAWIRNRGRAWRFPGRPVWPLRLVQIQLSLGYLFSAWAKIPGDTWQDGTAVGYALRIGDVVRFRVPDLVIDNLLVVNLLTYGTLALELALASLIWNRRLRPWLLVTGVGLHLGIHLTLEVGFFSWGMLVGYLAFVPAGPLERLAQRSRRSVQSRARTVDATPA